MNMGQKGLMVEELEKEVRSNGMVCNIIEVPVRNYKHIHVEVVSSRTGSVLAEVIDQGRNCFLVRFFEDLGNCETLHRLSSYIDYLKSKIGCDIGFSLESQNCYRVWVEEEDS